MSILSCSRRGGDVAPAPVRPVVTSPEREKPSLPVLDEGTAAECARLAMMRNLSPDAIALAVGRELLRFTDSREGRAWVVTDRDRWAAQTRRLDGKPWQRLTGSRASWPIGFADAVRRDRIALVEGGPDALAALHHAWASGCAEAVGVVCMIGAACRIPAECLPAFAGLSVRVFIHADAPSSCAPRGDFAGAGKLRKIWQKQKESAGVSGEQSFKTVSFQPAADSGNTLK